MQHLTALGAFMFSWRMRSYRDLPERFSDRALGAGIQGVSVAATIITATTTTITMVRSVVFA